MLLTVLLFTQLAKLEDLEPALVAEDLCAELDHLGVTCVVGWDVPHELQVPWLDIGDHLHVDFDLIGQLFVIKASID